MAITKFANQVMSIIGRRIAEGLRPLGFKPETSHVLRKDVNDVRWYIAVHSHPKSDPGVAEVFLSVAVFSEPLERRVPKLPESQWGWSTSQVRANIRRLAGLPTDPKATDAWVLQSEQQAQETADEMLQLVLKHGIPFLESIPSTDALVPVLRGGGYSIMGGRRRNYEADVWEGKVDPAITPWDPGPLQSAGPAMSLDSLIASLKKKE